VRRRPLLITLLAVLAALAVGASSPAPALADASVLSDCNAHQRLTEQRSVAALRAALSSMPADVKEYTNCYDVIQRALLAELGGGHTSGTAPSSSSGSGGSFFSAPVIVVVGVLILAAGAFGVLALRRRSA
jgi:hypothetical protein